LRSDRIKTQRPALKAFATKAEASTEFAQSEQLGRAEPTFEARGDRILVCQVVWGANLPAGVVTGAPLPSGRLSISASMQKCQPS
jgi:hypothetical protein